MALVEHTPYTHNLAPGRRRRGAARSFLRPRLLLQGFLIETSWMVLEIRVRQSVGQAHHSRGKSPGPEEKRKSAFQSLELSVCWVVWWGGSLRTGVTNVL